MQLQTFVTKRLGKHIADCSNEELYLSLLAMIKEQTAQNESRSDGKKLYYISAEFLIGKLLSNNLINLGLYDAIRAELSAHGKDLTAIEEVEPEPSLGNGGLGRLAACFLDSIATLGLNGDGVGLNYHYGLFKQVFKNHKQTETPNPWMEAESWLTDTGVRYPVTFGDRTVTAKMMDIAVVGYEGRINHLHLFDTDTVDESIIKDGITFDQTDIAKNLTLFLYPDDSTDAGRLLRIYQQYFMVSAAAQLILDECAAKGCNLHNLADYAVIQINDTHPTMVIPELIRLLTLRGISEDEAVEIVSHTCAYTNHTILAEALEKWPLAYLEKAVPQLVPIIKNLDARAKEKYPEEALAILDKNNMVHMAHIDIHYCMSVNGVAALHTEILEKNELAHFYEIYPQKFNNKTNGITFRRWLLHANPKLVKLIEACVGTAWRKDANELEKLLGFIEDDTVLTGLLAVKKDAKLALKKYLQETQGVQINENSIFDIQVKRLHEYKRQQLNALYVIHKYLEIKAGVIPATPLTVIFGAKAAPAYITAKDIIHLLLCLQALIENDPDVAPHLRLVMVENYNVTKAEKLIPACDISEQISLASKEASGTGNMKFMLNGAVTLGTLDGANVEIAQLVGEENLYLFGAHSDTVIAHYEKADYVARTYYENDARIRAAVDFMAGDALCAIGDKAVLKRLQAELLNKDWFMTLLDFSDYVAQKDRALADWDDRRTWAQKMLVNIAKAGYFSSDRTIAEYNRDIWHL